MANKAEKPTHILEDELKVIHELRHKYQRLSSLLVNNEVQMWKLEEEKEIIKRELLDHNITEQDKIQDLKSKYGDIQVDANSGEITYITK